MGVPQVDVDLRDAVAASSRGWECTEQLEAAGVAVLEVSVGDKGALEGYYWVRESDVAGVWVVGCW